MTPAQQLLPRAVLERFQSCYEERNGCWIWLPEKIVFELNGQLLHPRLFAFEIHGPRRGRPRFCAQARCIRPGHQLRRLVEKTGPVRTVPLLSRGRPARPRLKQGKPVSLEVHPELWRAVRRHAEACGTSIRCVVERALRREVADVGAAPEVRAKPVSADVGRAGLGPPGTTEPVCREASVPSTDPGHRPASVDAVL